MQSFEQRLNALLELIEGWMPVEEAQSLFNQMQQSLDWQQPDIHVFGKSIPIPRQQAWYGVKAYSYSGISLPPTPIPKCLECVHNRINAEFGFDFNSALINRYLSGQHSVGWHSDSEPELGPQPVLAILSLGDTRKIQFRSKSKARETFGLDLSPGSLLIMKAGFQSQFKHAIPKTQKQCSERISVTFRHLV